MSFTKSKLQQLHEVFVVEDLIQLEASLSRKMLRICQRR